MAKEVELESYKTEELERWITKKDIYEQLGDCVKKIVRYEGATRQIREVAHLPHNLALDLEKVFNEVPLEDLDDVEQS